MALWRILYASVLRQPVFSRKVLIAGAGKAGADLARRLDALGAELGISICGLIDDDPQLAGATIEGHSVLGRSDDLVRSAMELQCNEIVVAVTDPSTLSDTLGNELCRCWVLGIDVTPLPLFFEATLGELPAEHVGSDVFSIMYVQKAGLQRLWDYARRLLDTRDRRDRAVGDRFDVSVSCLMDPPRFTGAHSLSAAADRSLWAPLYGCSSSARWCRDAEKDGAVWAKADDTRVTRAGRFMRKTRIDELPQLWNVLRGSMSLVGPRPERPEFVQELSALIPYYDLRHSVRPGLTGWAQVRYPYGNTPEDARAKLRYDLYYVKHRGLLLDLSIVLKTVGTIARMEGI